MSRWIYAGRIADIPPRGARVVHARDMDIAVFHASDGDVFALEDRCPHRGGPISQGIVHGGRVTCPLHDWCIELASGEAVAPDKGCVRVFPVRVVDGVIELDLAPAALPACAAK